MAGDESDYVQESKMCTCGIHVHVYLTQTDTNKNLGHHDMCQARPASQADLCLSQEI